MTGCITCSVPDHEISSAVRQSPNRCHVSESGPSGGSAERRWDGSSVVVMALSRCRSMWHVVQFSMTFDIA